MPRFSTADFVRLIFAASIPFAVGFAVPVIFRPAPATLPAASIVPIRADSQSRAPHAVNSSATTAAVTRAIDGDTFDLAEIDLPPRSWRARLLGVDTPEHDEPGFAEATAALAALVEGRNVRIEWPADGRLVGNFGRVLAWVFVAGDDGSEILVNAEIVRLGWSRHATDYGRGKYADRLDAAEVEARNAGRGAWGFEPCPWPVWPVDVRTAPDTWLDEIPGVGEGTIQRIRAAVAELGEGLRVLDDLKGVQKITAADVERWRPWLRVGD